MDEYKHWKLVPEITPEEKARRMKQEDPQEYERIMRARKKIR
jgi:hypothetical protein